MREMKNSGVDVIGSIPLSWKLRRLKYLCDIQTGNEDTQNADPDGEYPFYVRSPVVEKCHRYTFDGEGILMAGDGAGAGRIFHHVYGKYAVHQRVYRLSNFINVDTDYFYYHLSNIFPLIMDKGSAQSTVPSVRLPMLLNCELCLPPLSEQHRIASFLDAKCAEIDALATDIQAQIDTLEQYKRSVITEAVTKGLNPNAEMKDSGVPWIEEIPVGWNIVKSKHILVSNDGGVWGADPHDGTQTKTVLRSTEQTIDGKWSIIDPALRDLSGVAYNGCRIMPGDLLVTKSSGSASHIGKTTLADDYFLNHECYYSNFLQRLRVSCDPRYAWYLFNTKMVREQFVYRQNSTSGIGNINSVDLENVYLPYPTLQEQHCIISFLDAKCERIDETIKQKQEQLATIEEYKKSLIFEYVTGKKEVENV